MMMGYLTEDVVLMLLIDGQVVLVGEYFDDTVGVALVCAFYHYKTINVVDNSQNDQ